MAIIASRSLLSVLFLILVITDEVFCRGHIEYPDEDELAEFAIAEVNKLAHTHYIMVNLESSSKKVSRDVFSYTLSISAKISGASIAKTYLAKVGIERKGEHANKMMLVSFKSRGGPIIYEMPTLEASTSSHINHSNTRQRHMAPDQRAELLDRLRQGGGTSRNMNK
ncbi:hypothetical protein CASFOL_013098 [Castilleja foliolosa]|uniref:Cystatin domain-containing protein n=1 Tax=Castilleja foliolosa TaxID=1961234 RepID=A0ABD3DJ06_9LAMI